MSERSEGVDPPEGLLRRAKEYHHQDTLPPEEYEALTRLGAQLVNSGQHDAQFFILGSYEEPYKTRLIDLRSKLEGCQGSNYRAYLMEDLPEGLHPIVRFRLVADYSDHIIGVCEHDQGGFQLELGMVIVLTNYFERAYLLRREYPPKLDHERYNWMLDAGVFDMFEYEDRLWKWRDSNYEDACDELLGSL